LRYPESCWYYCPDGAETDLDCLHCRWWHAYSVYSEKQRSFAELAKLNVDRAVSVLPPGTQDVWVAYVERRVAAAIQSKASAISVTSGADETTYVSRNTPFKVSCNPRTGGSVEFGYGENSVSVPIYGWLVDWEAEKAPPLGVIESSVAAATLSKTLCERISATLSKVVQP
jgi:hypothetical protein